MIEQDPVNFLRNLCNKFEIINKITNHEIETRIRCPGCDYRPNSNLGVNHILTLELNSQEHKSYTLQQIIDENIDVWRDTKDHCKNKCQNYMQTKIILQIALEKILILRISLLLNKSKLTEIKINEVSKAKIAINKKYFQVISAIFYVENNQREGNYFNMLREINNWFLVSETGLQKKPWPKGSKNAYIFFLEQCKAPLKRH